MNLLVPRLDENLMVWQDIADAIRRDHLSHDARAQRLEMLAAMIDNYLDGFAHTPEEVRIGNALYQFLFTLIYPPRHSVPTHTVVKIRLRFFAELCAQFGQDLESWRQAEAEQRQREYERAQRMAVYRWEYGEVDADGGSLNLTVIHDRATFEPDTNAADPDAAASAK